MRVACRGAGGEGAGGRRRPRHMWSLPTRGIVAAAVSVSADAEAAAAAVEQQQGVGVLTQRSAEFFVKDGRRIRVGDCALFLAGDIPPFIGLIRSLKTSDNNYPTLRVSWLYRPADIKLTKGIQLKAAPNEVFYSFHQDEISAVSLLHPCKVAFLRRGLELPAGTPSFVCWRVYDIVNKCLWWLTDQDYVNERQEEVDQLLNTSVEMHAAAHPGSKLSPKPLNDTASSPQKLKTETDGGQILSSCVPAYPKGKKRDQNDHQMEPAKRTHHHQVKLEGGDSSHLKAISDIAEKGGLVNIEAVDKLVELMYLDKANQKIDLAGQVMLVDVIAATEKKDCLDRLMHCEILPVLNDWLQEIYKGKVGNRACQNENDRDIDKLVLSLLRALGQLPINLSALMSCNIGKTVNNFRGHKNLQIQKKARSLIDTWKKRVGAEMDQTKPVGSSKAVSWPGKTGFSDVAHPGSLSEISASKTLITNPGMLECCRKLRSLSSDFELAEGPVTFSSEDSPSTLVEGNPHAEPQRVFANEEKFDISSLPLKKNQSYSTDHAKAMNSSGPVNVDKSSCRLHHGEANNVHLNSAVMEPSTSVLDNTLLSGTACQKNADQSVSDNGGGHRLIVRFPNPCRSPALSVSGVSIEKAGKHAYASRCHLHSESDPESLRQIDAKGPIGSDEHHENSPDIKVNMSARAFPSSSITEKDNTVCDAERKELGCMNALIESCVEYPESGMQLQLGDDSGMVLLASVATGEICKSEIVTHSGTSRKSTASAQHFDADNDKSRSDFDVSPAPGLRLSEDTSKGEDSNHCVGSDEQSDDENGIVCAAVSAKCESVANDDKNVDTQAVNADGGSSSDCNSSVLCSKSPSKNDRDELLTIRKSVSSAYAEEHCSPTGNQRRMHQQSSSCSAAVEKYSGDEPERVIRLTNIANNLVLNNAASNNVSGNTDADDKVMNDSEKGFIKCEDFCRKDIAGSDRGESALAVKEVPNITDKLGFDLNEGISGNDMLVSEHAAVNPISSGCWPAPVTVAAAGKRPFVPPENLWKAGPETTGWRGSAATSAFRPAKPRKVEQPSASSVPASSPAGSRARAPLDIDLNVTEDVVLKEAESTGYWDATAASMIPRLQLDLNRVHECRESAHLISTAGRRCEAFLPLPARQLPGGIFAAEANTLRNIDLNDGPGLDFIAGETTSMSQIPFFPVTPGTTLSSWFSPGNLPDIREKPCKVLAAPGGQRVVGPVTSIPLGTESYRSPPLSLPYPYSIYPSGPNFLLPAPAFSGCLTSTSYADPLHSRTIPSQFHRPPFLSMAEGITTDALHVMSQNWPKPGLDLNIGPRAADADVNKVLSVSKQNMSEQLAVSRAQEIGLKRKELPECRWDPERSSYKKLSWQ